MRISHAWLHQRAVGNDACSESGRKSNCAVQHARCGAVAVLLCFQVTETSRSSLSSTTSSYVAPRAGASSPTGRPRAVRRAASSSRFSILLTRQPRTRSSSATQVPVALRSACLRGKLSPCRHSRCAKWHAVTMQLALQAARLAPSERCPVLELDWDHASTSPMAASSPSQTCVQRTPKLQNRNGQPAHRSSHFCFRRYPSHPRPAASSWPSARPL